MGSQRTKIISLSAVGIAIAVALLSLARVSHANAPARNGRIVFSESLDPNLSVEAFTVNPDGSDLRKISRVVLSPTHRNGLATDDTWSLPPLRQMACLKSGS
jgi:hypothetical protein